MFAVTPRVHCDHIVGGLHPVPAEGLDSKKPCKECGHVGETWVCLCCYEVRTRTRDYSWAVVVMLTTHVLIRGYSGTSL